MFEHIPKLGFGLMRLPMNGGEIDIAQTAEMVDLFLDSGFTYFDTAYVYFEGKSEMAAKEVLFDRHPREKFQFATKLPAWAQSNKTADDAKQMFWTSLKRTGAEYFDFYVMHNLSASRTKAFDDFGMWDYFLELKEKGLIRHMGFSFHDKANVLDELLSKHPETEFVMLQLNYADWESGIVQSRLCHEVARKHNVPIIAMEPVRGGMLGGNLPMEVQSVLREADPASSCASWAIRFAASLDGVFTVLSGMSNIDQLRDNIGYMKDFKPLSDKEYSVIDKARETLAALPSIPCTSCDYCIPVCPKGLVIPQIFDMVNRDLLYKDFNSAKFGYTWGASFNGKGSDCIACGKCEEVCPQQIEISSELQKAAEKFED